MKRGSSWLSEHRNAVAVGILILRGEGVPYTFLQKDKTSLPASIPFSNNPSEKKSCDTVPALSPSIVFLLDLNI